MKVNQTSDLKKVLFDSSSDLGIYHSITKPLLFAYAKLTIFKALTENKVSGC